MATTSRSKSDLDFLVQRELFDAALKHADGWITFNELCRLLPPLVSRPGVSDALAFLVGLGAIEEGTVLVPQEASDPRRPRTAEPVRAFRVTRAALVDALRDAMASARNRGQGLLAALRQLPTPAEVNR